MRDTNQTPNAAPGAADEPVIGIDLGTTNSLVAYCDARGPHVIPDAQGRALLSSVVRFDAAGGQVLAVGHEARAHAVEFPRQTVFSIKRLMGRGLADATADLAYLPYEVVEGEHHTARVRVGHRVWSPQEISAVILRTLRQQAQAHLGRPVRKAVITVPAYFDDAQRQATRDAGRIAGLEVLRIVNEPTAASLAYNLGLRQARTADVCGSILGSGVSSLKSQASSPASLDTTVAVFDLGGGTFDFSILRLQHVPASAGEPAHAVAGGFVDQVLGTAGDTHLGGDDVDRMIVEQVQREIRNRFFPDTPVEQVSELFPPATRQALRDFAETAKIRLSQADSARIEIDLGQGRLYQRTFRRDELEAMMSPWLERALDCCRRALARAGLAPADIERVILVGGTTRTPLVRRRVAELFGSEPYTALDPDQVVALGAAVQASILAGHTRDLLLLDVIPLSLGIETMGGAVAKLIVANQTIPAAANERFTTFADGQTRVKIHVVQGERELVRDCRSLGTFELSGIPPMPAGLPKINVSFLVDANGILCVSAVEERSGKAATLQVVPNHGLSREEVARMEADSYAHAREDMTAHRLIDLRNQAHLDIRNIQRQLQRVRDRLDAEYLQQIDGRIAAVQRFIDDPRPDPDVFHQALDAMDKTTLRLAEVAIQKTLEEENPGRGAG